MKTISITELDDSGWRDYFGLTQELSRRYYPEFYDISRDVHSFKNELMNDYLLLNKFNHQQYLIMNNDSPVGWFKTTDYPRLIAWDFDVCSDEINDDIFQMIMKKVYVAYNEANSNHHVYNWVYDKRKITAVKKTGALISERLLISRLYRKDMNIELYSGISDKLALGMDYKILYLNKFPGEIIQKLPAFFNECNKDINTRRPDPIEYIDQTEEDIRRYINLNTGVHSVNHILALVHNTGELAGVCSLFEDKNKVRRLRHTGGFTGVAAKYRGRGFGKFMKSYLYDKLIKDNVSFEYASTDTMPWNIYMFRINEELGFKPHKEGFEFKLKKEDLEKYLESAGKREFCC